MKKFVEKHFKKAKAKYYEKYFTEHKNNSKKQWEMINSLLKRKKKKISVTKLIDEDGKNINSPQEISEKFNDYFANIAGNLKSKMNQEPNSPSSQNPFSHFSDPPVSNSIYLRPVTPGEVYEIIDNFKNKSTLDTKISALKIANTNHKFTEALAKIVTTSFQQGVFPASLKIAKLIPIHKGGKKTEVENYRPISLLATFSKIYEKLMNKRFVSFFEENNTIYENQYGFRPGRSCEHALLNAQQVLSNVLNKKQIGLLLLIDFSKAFDMVEHDILLAKLSNYGIRGIALDWIKSYLSNREQYVCFNGKKSTVANIKYGVPQGSILGPLLFIIYINDISNISDLATFILYADDVNIIITGHSEAEIRDQLTDLINKLVSWVDSNGLALNLKKTNYMLFSRKRNLESINFKIKNLNIERKTEARFLGIIIDEKLDWSKHITALKSKMSRYLGVMYKIKFTIPLKARLQIYHSFIQSHLNYCSVVWGFSCNANIEKLLTLQKKGLRSVMPGYVTYFYKNGVMPTGTKSFFKKYNILTVQSVIAKNTLLYMIKITRFKFLLPKSIIKLIPNNSPNFDPLESVHKEWMDKYNTLNFRKTLFFKGPLLYNDFVKACPVLSAKNCVKKFLLEYQSMGDPNVWESSNNILANISGPRRSERTANVQ